MYCVGLVFYVLNNEKLMLDISWLLFVVWDVCSLCKFGNLGHCCVLFIFSYSLLMFLELLISVFSYCNPMFCLTCPSSFL
jgi:hypothetical protein